MRDKDTPKYVKAVIAGALGYLVLPIDIVPDTIPVLGWIDDVAVLGLAFKIANRYIKTRHQEEAKNTSHFVAVTSFLTIKRQFNPLRLELPLFI